ncbi:hypothetical protein [Amycolatopsis sp. cmx-11-12]|uniref:hypothetical protein n=1 Tax=Amycolatopsis sp. cmx-11-12 TaxID=2785795 RepID=UPI00391812FC
MQRIARFALVALAVLLMSQFFVCTATPTFVHEPPATGIEIAKAGVAETRQFEQESASCIPPDHTYPNGLPPVRDRHRTTADLTPQPVVHPMSACAHRDLPVDAPISWRDACHRGTPAAHSPAMLQVFLC